jgi:enoyl-CoA hydratase/carnithine racemase
LSALQTITYETAERIARITLDRPARGNGITRQLVTELEQCVEQADLDPTVHAILLSGNGKGFCGGYDLVESAEGRGRPGRQSMAPQSADPRHSADRETQESRIEGTVEPGPMQEGPGGGGGGRDPG